MLEVCFSLVFCLLPETGSVHFQFTVVRWGLGLQLEGHLWLRKAEQAQGWGRYKEDHSVCLGLALTNLEG